jgi:hypothetical protein
VFGSGLSMGGIVLAKAAHCESASGINSYFFVNVAVVIIILVDEVYT